MEWKVEKLNQLYNKTENNTMAKLECTEEEFTSFIGPLIRNKVQAMTKKEKAEQKGKCRLCRKKEVLQAAHILGHDRPAVIKEALESYRKKDQNYYIIEDLSKAIEDIHVAHLPVNKKFVFLCPDCHRQYDKLDDERKDNKDYIRAIFEFLNEKKNVLSDELLAELLDKDYSKQKIGFDFPVLSLNREVNKERYYATPINLNNKDYFLCNHLFDKQRKALVEWINCILISD